MRSSRAAHADRIRVHWWQVLHRLSLQVDACAFRLGHERRDGVANQLARVNGFSVELEAAGILEIKQRGLGKTNLYRLHLTIKKLTARRRN